MLLDTVTFCYATTGNALVDSIKYKIYEENLGKLLVKNGFENVSILSGEEQTIVAFENRVYRHELEGLHQILDLLAATESQVPDRMSFLFRNRDIPVAAVTLSVSQYRDFQIGQISKEAFSASIDVSFEIDELVQKMRSVKKSSSSFSKLDIIVHPQFHARYGNYDDPVKSQINLAPELTTTLWPGMRVSAQVILPLQNELEREGDYVRPGFLTLNQTLRLPENFFVSTTLGYFTENRYGLDFEFKKYFAQAKWALGGNLGYTGFASYMTGVWRYSNPNTLTTFVNAEYRYAPLDLVLKATLGRFLEHDKGVRLDVVRQIGELDLGFYGLQTEDGNNGGFELAVPIFPPKRLPPGRLRISPTKTLRTEYRYKGLANVGRLYETGNGIDDFLERLNPDYIKNQIVSF